MMGLFQPQRWHRHRHRHRHRSRSQFPRRRRRRRRHRHRRGRRRRHQSVLTIRTCMQGMVPATHSRRRRQRRRRRFRIASYLCCSVQAAANEATQVFNSLLSTTTLSTNGESKETSNRRWPLYSNVIKNQNEKEIKNESENENDSGRRHLRGGASRPSRRFSRFRFRFRFRF